MKAERCRCGRRLVAIPAIHSQFIVCSRCFLFDTECPCQPVKATR